MDLRRRAAVVLGRIGEADDAAVEGLVSSLDDGDRLVRLKAAMSLGQLGERDGKVLPVLLMKLSQGSMPQLRRGLVASIGNMGPGAKDAVGRLILLLDDADSDVREEAAESLMKIGTLEAMNAVERRNRRLP